MSPIRHGFLLVLLSLSLVACGGDETEQAAATGSSSAVAAESTTAEQRESRVTFEYSGDFEGTADTAAVIAGLMRDDLTGITANLDGYSSDSDTLSIQLRNTDFVVGTPTDVFASDRNTISFSIDGYSLQLQPGSTLTVLEKSGDVFRAEADELTLTGYETMDFQRQNPPKTVTIRNLRFDFFD